ncbi:hypothetical protein [Streptomyces sp. B6B3]|uniref:hypothetical protein n=1 Tax=Streptomyces sp. B6B3 TaxID=3153570 RepID=UPI00325CE095
MKRRHRPLLTMALVAASTLAAGALPVQAAAAEGPALAVDLTADRYPISPDIYGMNFADPTLLAELELPVDRWGGNATTRFNYLNDTSNRASDWFFENIPNEVADPSALPEGSTSNQFVEKDLAAGADTIMTVR